MRDIIDALAIAALFAIPAILNFIQYGVGQ